jgi:drug/metabolite transporter (DMT)-like permease
MSVIPDQTASRRATLLGIASVLAAVVLFSLSDMAIKLLSGGYALHQVVLIRSLIGMAVLLAVIVPFQGGYGGLKTGRLAMHLLRGACVVTANMSFFAALASMPLADAVAIFFVAPMLITAFSVVMLGEKVGPRRWISVLIGLLGVIVMLRPGTDAFRLVSLLPLVAATAYALLHILTRKIGGTERAVTMAFYIQLTFIVVSGSMGLMFGHGQFAGSGNASIEFLFRAWVWPAAADWPLLIMIGVSTAFAAVLISQAYRLCEAALVAPFEYAAMPIAVFWGVVVFGEWPDSVAWIGIALIVGGGLYMFWREARTGNVEPVPRTRR